MQLSDYAQALGAAQALIPSWDEPQRRRAELQAATLQNRAAQMQLDQAARQQADEDEFEQAVKGLGGSPTLDGLRGIAVRFPKFGKTINDTISGMEKSAQRQTISTMAQIHSALGAGRTDLAASLIQRRVDAAKTTGGQADPADTAMLDMINSGDPEKVKAAKGFVFATLAAADPENVGKTLIEAGDKQGGKVLRPGDIWFNDDGTERAKAPFAPDYKTVSEGQSLVEVNPGGGDPESGGGASQPRRSMGWTPRARDGGENSDAAVDAKLVALGKATGLGVDTPLTQAQVAQVIGAIPATEGGPNDLPERNNNPGAIKDGAWAKRQPGYAGASGGFARFNSRDAGMAAAQRLGAQYFNRGQRTIRDIIEGKPVGGGSTGGARVVAQGAPKARYRILTASEVQERGLAPGQYQESPDGQVTAIGGKSVGGERKDEAGLRKEFNGRAEVKTFLKARPQFVALKNLVTKPNPTPQDDIAIVFNFMKALDPDSVVREGEFATAQNAGSVPDSIVNLYNRVQSGQRLNPAQRRNMLGTAFQSYRAQRDAYNSVAQEYRSYASDYGVNPDRVAPVVRIEQSQGGGAPKRVRTLQEALALPKGTVFIDPRGQRRVR